jgi:hypothetical protein
METSTSIKEISKALLEAQKNMTLASKDSDNPYFKSKYADLNAIREACLPALNKAGVTALQPTVNRDNKNYVQTILLHESGEFISSLTEIIYSKQNDAQSQGSGITYARRYGLQSLMNVGAEDDDGNKASNPQPKTPTAQKPELKRFDGAGKNIPAFIKAVQHIAQGGSIEQVEKTYFISEELKKVIFNEAKTVSA